MSSDSAGAGPTIAKVGAAPIAQRVLDHWSAVAGDVPPGQPVDTRQSTLRAVLGRLIGLYAILEEATEHHVAEVSDAEARKALDVIEAREGGTLGLSALDPVQAKGTWLASVWGERSLQQLTESLGATPQDRLWLVKVALVAERLKQAVTEEAIHAVATARIARFYRQHIRSYRVPEKRDFEAFMTRHLPEAEAGKREILAGTSFRVVAKLRNMSPEAHEGLVMGLVRGEGEPPFERYIYHAPLHKLVGPIEQALFYVFRVTKIIPPSVRPLSEVRGSIQQRLADHDVTAVLLPALQRRWVAKTTCQPAYLVADCAQSSKTS